jgi:hypothetical protein
VRAAALFLIVVVGPGCAWDAGEPFGEIEGTLTARWTTPASRDRGDGWQKLASDFEIRLDAATWTTSGLTLVPAATAAVSFDPASPPPGYSLCHAGHCHADDGRLVAYEDVAAELAGDTPPAPVATFSTGALDLAAGAQVPLGCDGPCPLPRTVIGRAELVVASVALAGAVRDTRAEPRIDERAWRLTLAPAAPLPVLGRTDLAVDRGEEPSITLAVALEPTAALLDRVAWEDLAAVPGELVVDSDVASITAITAELAELALTLSVTRSD